MKSIVSVFILSAGIIEYKLENIESGNVGRAFGDLLDLLKKLNKDELRLFRNAFYAKNGCMFKDSALNK